MSRQYESKESNKVRQATLTTDSLEPRILLSATWVDAEVDDVVDESTDEANDIQGTDGNDVLDGTDADDSLFGNEGDDLLRGNDGNDKFIYQEGDGIDRFQGGEGKDIVDATDAETLNLRYMTQSDSIEALVGGKHGLNIEGTGERDVFDFTNTQLVNVQSISTGAGNDYVAGSAGDDLINGGTGNDDLRGGDGNDTFIYQEGDGVDRFQGGEGKDIVDATDAKTLNLRYMTQSDSIEAVVGGKHGLNIEGTGERDVFDFTNTQLVNVQSISTGAGNDYVAGSAGDDLIYGGTGNDDLRGGDGNDTFIYQEGDGIDRFQGGEGKDIVDATDAKTLNLRYMTQSDSIEAVVGGKHGLNIEGTGERDVFDFTNTQLVNVQSISTGAGNDYVAGSAGDDLIYGGTGNDDLRGGDGNDTFIYQEGDGIDRFQGGEGKDIVDATDAKTLNLRYMTQSDSIEAVVGGKHGLNIEGTGERDVFDFTNTQLVNVQSISTGAGNDDITGSDGDDVIIGGSGNDRIRGGAGHDTAVFSGNIDDFAIEDTGNGTFKVTDLRGNGGEDIISDVEVLRFMDGDVRSDKLGEEVDDKSSTRDERFQSPDGVSNTTSDGSGIASGDDSTEEGTGDDGLQGIEGQVVGSDIEVQRSTDGDAGGDKLAEKADEDSSTRQEGAQLAGDGSNISDDAAITSDADGSAEEAREVDQHSDAADEAVPQQGTVFDSGAGEDSQTAADSSLPRTPDDIEGDLNRAEELLESESIGANVHAPTEFAPLGGLVTPETPSTTWEEIDVNEFQDVTTSVAPRLRSGEQEGESQTVAEMEMADEQLANSAETRSDHERLEAGTLASIWSWVRAYGGMRGDSHDGRERSSRR